MKPSSERSRSRVVKNAQESEQFLGGEQEEGGRQGHRERPPVPDPEGRRRNHPRPGRLRQGQLPGHVHRRQGIRQLLRERRAGTGPGRRRHQGLDRGPADDEDRLQVAALRARRIWPTAGAGSVSGSRRTRCSCSTWNCSRWRRATRPAQPAPAQAAQTRKMNITGEIGKVGARLHHPQQEGRRAERDLHGPEPGSENTWTGS